MYTDDAATSGLYTSVCFHKKLSSALHVADDGVEDNVSPTIGMVGILGTIMMGIH
jgi:hypothetical protein